jgi:ABC-type transport system substrate-binding protein
MRTKLLSILGLLVVLSLVATQCGPTPAPQTIIQTVEVEKTVQVVQTVQVQVEKTVQVTKEVQITATPEAPKPKGALTIALATNPNTLDAPICAERNCQNAAGQLFDSLLWVNDQSEIEPALAEAGTSRTMA